MASMAEILGARPDKIKFEGGKPPEIGAVPAHTYGVLLEAKKLELLDGPNTVDRQPSTAPFIPKESTTEEKPLTREEQMVQELAEIAKDFNVPTRGTVERSDNTIFEWKSPHYSVEKKIVQEVQNAPQQTQSEKPESPKPVMGHNKLNHDANMRIFSGQLGKNIFERGRVVNMKKGKR